MQQEPVVIRKYANRRLYDSSARKYINLQQIANLIRQGSEVKIVDAQTGEDVTRVVLTQIIVEDARQQPAGLPLELLRHLIMASDRAGQEFIMWYLKSAFDAYHRVQETLQSGVAEARNVALSPLNLVKNLIAAGTTADTEQELVRLRHRVAELEESLPKRRR